MDHQTTKLFVVLGAFATSCVTVVAVVAIWLDASWAAIGIVIAIVAATATAITPIANQISLRFRQKGESDTELDVNVSTRSSTQDDQSHAEVRQHVSRSFSVLIIDSWEGKLGLDHSTEALIENALQDTNSRPFIRTLKSINAIQLAEVLSEHWDIVHFDCAVSTDGELKLSGEDCISSAVLRQLLEERGVRLAVFASCDSVRVVGATHNAGVYATIAVAGYLFDEVYYVFTETLYKSIGKGANISTSFQDALSSAAVKTSGSWDRANFVLSVSNDLGTNW